MIWCNEVPLEGLCDELDLLPRNNVLEILDIEMDVSTDLLSAAQEEPWGQLDCVLSQSFSCLWRGMVVIFQVGKRLPEIAQIQQFEKVSQAQFAWLRENTAVEFDFSTSCK